MGRGDWSDKDYRRRESARRITGESAFKYTDREMSGVPRSERKVNQAMDPKDVTRESRDSTAHPESLAIGVIFDHTGSMGQIPRILQKQLAQLMGSLISKGRIENPQILFGAIGDATTDRAPLQIGQFESDVNMENDLGRLLLEGYGGAYGQESYELAIYFMARHTSTDCWEKREKKGYLFLIGDEKPYDVKKEEVMEIIGDKLSQNIAIEEVIAEAKQKYNVFFIIPTDANGGKDPEVLRRWVGLLGQEHVIQLKDPEEISDKIAVIVRVMEEKDSPPRVKIKNAKRSSKKTGRI